jgi:hypothetical protein
MGEFVEVRQKNQIYKINPKKALDLQKELRITHLATTLLSNNALDLFACGWKFAGVLKNGEGQYSIPGREYRTLDIGNQWNDKALFVRLREEEKKSKKSCIQERANSNSGISRAVRDATKYSIYEWIAQEEI